MKTSLPWRSLLVIALPLALSSCDVKGSSRWLGDAGIDIQKARARRDDQKADQLRYEQATTVGDYDRIGLKDPRWDADARTTLDEMAHALAPSSQANLHTAAARAACQRAMAAGCNDPLMGYFAVRLGVTSPRASGAELTALYGRAEEAVESSGYSSLRKLYASFRSAEQASRTETKNPGPAGVPGPCDPPMRRATAHLIETFRDPAVQRESLYTVANEFFHFAEHNTSGQALVFEPVEKAFASDDLKAFDETTTGKLIEGDFWVSYAWQARTSKYAQDVTEEGWQHFSERLAKAADALEKAYALDASNVSACLTMVTVELGQGQGRDRMETWFRRAMNADPDSYDACDRKLLYLEPKWYGSENEMLEFGHQCEETANWPSRIPFILLQAHTSLASYEHDSAEYWRKPKVWADLQQLYAAALAADPKSNFDRSAYLLYACRAEDWKLADKLIKELGPNADLNAMKCTPEQYEQMRKRVAAQLAGSS